MNFKLKIFSSVSLAIFIAFMALAAFAHAAPARCALVKVAKKGMRLGDVVGATDIKELLIIQRVNAIQNPYDLKEGLLIMVPEKSFIEKARELPFAEMVNEINAYRERIPQSVLKEVAESAAGVKDAVEAGAQAEKTFDRNVPAKSMGGLRGSKPEEIERISFPRKPKY
ncbi:MAG TPA: hypothetical protein PK467_00635 [Candidatus Wallbacteria bacterium]|nr:hypothetical protein [Candidatus Wallbacteria bacterium]